MNINIWNILDLMTFLHTLFTSDYSHVNLQGRHGGAVRLQDIVLTVYPEIHWQLLSLHWASFNVIQLLIYGLMHIISQWGRRERTTHNSVCWLFCVTRLQFFFVKKCLLSFPRGLQVKCRLVLFFERSQMSLQQITKQQATHRVMCE